jgi:hypothetical protein
MMLTSHTLSTLIIPTTTQQDTHLSIYTFMAMNRGQRKYHKASSSDPIYSQGNDMHRNSAYACARRPMKQSM